MGSVVTKSPKRAKEWRDSLKALLPPMSGPEGIKQTQKDGKKMNGSRYLSWVNMMLLVHEGTKQGKIVQVILLPDIVSVTAKNQSLTVVDKNGMSKWDMPTVYDADVWESYIAQFLVEREEEVERVRYGE